MGNQLPKGRAFCRPGTSLPVGLVAVDTACLSGLVSDGKVSLHQMGYAEKA